MQEKNYLLRLVSTPLPQQLEMLPTRGFFDKNFGPGKLDSGGPTCVFKGKEVPCMVRWSPKGSITSPILAEDLAHIDSFNVMERRIGLYLFLLLDGHNSRFKLPYSL